MSRRHQKNTPSCTTSLHGSFFLNEEQLKSLIVEGTPLFPSKAPTRETLQHNYNAGRAELSRRTIK
ncbi:MAG: hypothetical protein ACD_42C00367G0004 [uncultured bacterium]|nr:MAG: hypothetical protein ACD_42C00367G0004 [uncultured bacterium]OGT34600.1 MAG: hypothetical protein A3C44_07220 [Gammaproteobacteria bacterium RIFCSPHIGHO2_02_FULL_39_13]OGT50021.1 MAG: hypothetical protein A3E53_02325 [Gammaproteobacteria bacterium RIFCSPHIGHO2_12_FULL_39_24]